MVDGMGPPDMKKGKASLRPSAAKDVEPIRLHFQDVETQSFS